MRKNNSIKKSQIQLGESITVIIIIIILIVIGLAIYNKFYQEDWKNSNIQYGDLSVIELAKTITEFPELRCYTINVNEKVNCFDYYKILALNKSMNDPLTKKEYFDYYNNYFKNSRITFRSIYPADEFEITIYDNNISSTRTLYINIPIIIEKNTGRTVEKNFGMIIIEGYLR